MSIDVLAEGRDRPGERREQVPISEPGLQIVPTGEIYPTLPPGPINPQYNPFVPPRNPFEHPERDYKQ